MDPHEGVGNSGYNPMYAIAPSVSAYKRGRKRTSGYNRRMRMYNDPRFPDVGLEIEYFLLIFSSGLVDSDRHGGGYEDKEVAEDK